MLYEVITLQKNPDDRYQSAEQVQKGIAHWRKTEDGKHELDRHRKILKLRAATMRRRRRGHGCRITSYNVCYTKLLRGSHFDIPRLTEQAINQQTPTSVNQKKEKSTRNNFV